MAERIEIDNFSIDCVIFGFDEGKLKALFIKEILNLILDAWLCLADSSILTKTWKPLLCEDSTI